MINQMSKHIASEMAMERTKEIGNREGWSDKASFKKLDFKKRLEGKVFVEYMGEKVKRCSFFVFFVFLKTVWVY